MKDVLAGRVDLVRALDAGGAELQDAVAALLGFEREPKPPPPPTVEPAPSPPPGPGPGPEPETTPVRIDVPFWQARDFEAREPYRPDEPVPVEPEPAATRSVAVPSAALASGVAILTRLRRYAAFSDASCGIDLDRTVDRLGRGRFLHTFPRRPRRRWGPWIQVVCDRSRRLAPFWLDQDLSIQGRRVLL